MPFTLRPMTEEDARRLCEWRYPEPYDRYRWPAWEEMAKEGREFADPDIRAKQYVSFADAKGELAGYAQLFPLDRAVRLGIGLRPDLCGLGLGPEAILLAAREARRRRPDADIDLEVETWNERAVKAYKKAGFVVEDEYGKRAEHGIVRVLCMVWRERSPGPDRGAAE
ncbi:GNAT family N-acetyltransferase [Cohnella caldifontis]|uniref:GNAT family N-acetyltransferase n=1 Tax=Cohnella caldifontis TaxID=3027471 RepID=UPI0023ED61B1|nr:GNAT family protein [Cohnella sp. YIM B05605]